MTGLLSYTNYTVSVVAVNKEGLGEENSITTQTSIARELLLNTPELLNHMMYTLKLKVTIIIYLLINGLVVCLQAPPHHVI